MNVAVNAVDVAVNAVKAAGTLIKENFRKEQKISSKDDIGNNLVTATDYAAEKAIVSIIKKAFPDHNIISEETTFPKTSSHYTWYIDPLDGTNNFARGIPLSMTGVTLAKDNIPMLTAVYDPYSDELFTAEKSKGAYLNGKRISVSKRPLQNAAIAFEWTRTDEKTFFNELASKTGKLMTYMCAYISLTYVASGRLDGALFKWRSSHGNPWDFAPMLLVQEAGGKVTALDGSPFIIGNNNLVASNGIIHDELLRIIK